METEFEDLKGKTITNIIGLYSHSEMVIFETLENETYRMFHGQECCESVDVNDVCGDISDLLNTPILDAEECCSNGEHWGTFTWTFYKLSTIKGDVTIRWYGESNGYYSERVEFENVK